MAEKIQTKASTLALRPANPKDAEAIASLGGTVFSSTFGYSIPPKDLEVYLQDSYSTSAVLKDLADSNVSILVAYDTTSSPEDHVVIGFVQLRRGSSEPCIENSERPVELQRLYVRAQDHGNGVARKLVDRIEDMAREEGFKTMWLGVWEENFSAQRVYQRFGYVKVGSHDFAMGECVQTDWIFSKSL